MANILSTLGARIVTGRNKQDKVIVEGISFSALPVPSVSGAMAPLFLGRKSIERVAGSHLQFQRNKDLRSTDEIVAAYTDLTERMEPTLSLLLADKNVDMEEFVSSVISKVQNFKVTSSKDKTKAARNMIGRALPFSTILEGAESEEFQNALAQVISRQEDLLEALKNHAADPTALASELCDLGDEFGVDLVRDRIKFKDDEE